MKKNIPMQQILNKKLKCKIHVNVNIYTFPTLFYVQLFEVRGDVVRFVEIFWNC